MSFRIPVSRLCAITPRVYTRAYSAPPASPSASASPEAAWAAGPRPRSGPRSGTGAAPPPSSPSSRRLLFDEGPPPGEEEGEEGQRRTKSQPKKPIRFVRTYSHFPKDLFRCQPWAHFNLHARRDRGGTGSGGAGGGVGGGKGGSAAEVGAHDITVEHKEQVATKDCRVFPWSLEPWFRKAPNGFFLRENNKEMRYFMNHRARMRMYVFVIEAGTPVPEDLLLVNNFGSGRWYLEPGRIMTLGELNGKINSFMRERAPRMTHRVLKKAFREIERKKHPANPWPPGYRAAR